MRVYLEKISFWALVEIWVAERDALYVAWSDEVPVERIPVECKGRPRTSRAVNGIPHFSSLLSNGSGCDQVSTATWARVSATDT